MRKRFFVSLAGAVSFLLLQEGRALADDAKSPALVAAEDAQKIAEAEQSAAEAKLKKAKAERELADVDATQKAAQDTALANAQTAILNKQKAAADAQAALLAADQAGTKAKFGAVTANTVSPGTVTVNTGAGTTEATLLAAKALRTIADKIATEIGGDREYVILTGVDKPSFGNWRLFELKRQVLEKFFAQADEQTGQADRAYAALKVPEPTGEKGVVATESVGTVITGAGALLDSFAKLGSFFQTSYDFSPLTVASDNNLLAAAVARGLPGKAYIPGRWAAPDGAAEILNLLDVSQKARLRSAGTVATAQERLVLLAEALKAAGNVKSKQSIQNVVEAYQRAIAAHQAAQKAFDEFFASLGVSDAGQPPLITKVIDERFAAEKIKAGAVALILNVHATGGGSYSKKNIWTFFGDIPFSVMGGTVVSYLLLDNTGKLLGANEYHEHGGYYKINRVKDALAR